MRSRKLFPEERVLHNNICLPELWPPADHSFSYELRTPPYLLEPPEVLNIKIGRQLFIDDFCIENTSAVREFHHARYYSEHPVFYPDNELENSHKPEFRGPFAAPFSGGVWFNPANERFEMWYMSGHIKAGNGYGTAFAYSEDGIHWIRPDLKNGRNIVHPENAMCVWLDLEEQNPERRFKMTYNIPGKDLVDVETQYWAGTLDSMVQAFSPDGINWSDAVSRTGPTGDRNALFYNPFRNVWCFSVRACERYASFAGAKRVRRYWESRDLIENLPWEYNEPVPWVSLDKFDIGDNNSVCELYNLDAVAYESLLLGLFNINREAPDNYPDYRPKKNEISLGFSRDGFYWDRPDRRSFLKTSEVPEDWNYGNLQSVGGCCLVVGDSIYFYISGRNIEAERNEQVTSTGLAILRRDGFASMNGGDNTVVLLTRKLEFTGNCLFVNAVVADGGMLGAEILDDNDQLIEPFSLGNCVQFSGDSTRHHLSWRNSPGLSLLAGRHIKIKFSFSKCKLFAFWIADDERGASRGYVAAGGPGFNKATDE